MTEIRLGENIILNKFESLPPAELLIVKKLIGGYVRKACEHTSLEHEQTTITLLSSTKEYCIEVNIQCSKQHYTEQASDNNIFIALDKACKKALHTLGIDEI